MKEVIVIATNGHKEWPGGDAYKATGIIGMEIIKYCQENGIETPEFIFAPVGDGGGGTIDALFYASGGKFNREFIKKNEVVDPLGRPITAEYLSLDAKVKTAFIEMEKCSGLRLIESDKRNPLLTTSYGIGQLTLDAIERGHERIIIGNGGAGSHDIGVGWAQALGVEFFDADDIEIKPPYMNNESIERIRRFSLKEFFRKITGKVRIEVAGDVENPLLGRQGAAFTFGRQKGASEDQLLILERNAYSWADTLESALKKENEIAYDSHVLAHLGMAGYGKDYRQIPGTAGGGGITYTIMALGGYIENGGKLLLDLIDFRERIKLATLVITGEGRFDNTTLRGKAVRGVGEVTRDVARRQKRIIPVYAICGSIGEYDEARAKDYVDHVVPGLPKFVTPQEFKDMTDIELTVNLQKATRDAMGIYFKDHKKIQAR